MHLKKGTSRKDRSTIKQDTSPFPRKKEILRKHQNEQRKVTSTGRVKARLINALSTAGRKKKPK